MFKKIAIALGMFLLVMVAILLWNTWRAPSWPVQHLAQHPSALPDSALVHLSQALQIPTVSEGENLPIDTAAFRSFGAFIDRAYPMIKAKLTKTTINQFNYIYTWNGSDSTLAPIVLMGHYDVVPVEAASRANWTVAPFSGTITDSCVWGRGSVDDKSGVIAELEATESLLKNGYQPRQTIYLCFGHDEEISGHSARMEVEWLAAHHVHPALVLDEGGEISEEKIREVNRPVAVIGVAEKGYASFELSVEKPGGHSSMPEKETSIDVLVKGLARLRSETPPARFTPPVREFLRRVSSSSDIFSHRLAGANMWLFEKYSAAIISAKPEGAAMIHTTLVPTILQSGVKDNIIPAQARAVVNCRILPGENAATVESYIRKVLADDRIYVKRISQYGSDPSDATPIDGPAYKRIEKAVYQEIPRVLPSPYLNIGATDSRYFRRISEGVVNFLPMTDSKGFHGINERLPIRDFQRCIHFMMTIIEQQD